MRGPGRFDLLLAFVVELSDEQLQVRPIHRLLRGLPDGFDLAGSLAPFFDVVDVGGSPTTASSPNAWPVTEGWA